MNNVKQNIIIAMKICGMDAISEGGMYYALLSRGLTPDEATVVVKELLDEGKIIRSGCAFVLRRYDRTHGEEGSFGERSVCNS